MTDIKAENVESDVRLDMTHRFTVSRDGAFQKIVNIDELLVHASAALKISQSSLTDDFLKSYEAGLREALEHEMELTWNGMIGAFVKDPRLQRSGNSSSHAGGSGSGGGGSSSNGNHGAEGAAAAGADGTEGTLELDLERVLPRGEVERKVVELGKVPDSPSAQFRKGTSRETFRCKLLRAGCRPVWSEYTQSQEIMVVHDSSELYSLFEIMRCYLFDWEDCRADPKYLNNLQ